MSIADTLSAIKKELPPHIELVAVSKFKHPDLIMEAYKSGQRLFGENRPLELRDKAQLLPADIKWHFIGHLQTNKIKYIIDKVDLIESVDSGRLLEAIDNESLKRSLVVNCLLEVHVAKESSKQGFSIDEIEDICNRREQYKNIRICGLMTMASLTDDQKLIRSEFNQVKSLFDRLKHSIFKEDEHFNKLSMGMSGDYKIAIECGSTIVRIGSMIFGVR